MIDRADFDDTKDYYCERKKKGPIGLQLHTKSSCRGAHDRRTSNYELAWLEVIISRAKLIPGS